MKNMVKLCKVTSLLLAVCLSVVGWLPIRLGAEAYCLNYAYCQPVREKQVYTLAWAVRQPDRSWRLNFAYYGYIPANVRISVYGMSPYGNPVLLDLKLFYDQPVTAVSWSSFVGQCDIYYQVVAQIIVLKDNRPIDSASVTLNQYPNSNDTH